MLEIEARGRTCEEIIMIISIHRHFSNKIFTTEEFVEVEDATRRTVFEFTTFRKINLMEGKEKRRSVRGLDL